MPQGRAGLLYPRAIMTYDLSIIGAGWAGFNAAIAAARLGKTVCLIEENEIGGTCLNRGCIPTKVFVAESRKNSNLSEIQRRKTEVIARLSQGMNYLLKSHNITWVQGRGILLGPGAVSVGGKGEVKSKFVLLATGSEPKEISRNPFDRQRVVSSDDVLNWEVVPGTLLIVGGGFIGCEFASIFRRLGAQVTVVEMLDRLLPNMDEELGKKLAQAFQKQGIKVMLKTGLEQADPDSYEKVLVAVGRKSRLEDVCASSCSLRAEKGAIDTDRTLATSMKHVFAAGDCVGGYLLAHVAAYEGELAVSNMFQKAQNRDYGAVPSSVFTTPEVSSVGLTEQEAKAFGADYETKTIFYLSLGMAHVLGDTQGFVKVVVDRRKKLILGASIVGLEAAELVNLFSVIIKNKIGIPDLKRTVFAHPSLSEIVSELARAF
ncbi:dihydrolipoamide dehydrogenase of 2-oxoglutarate dehydrogenase [Candidatus Velamenicoccus archaeovorus]|uniref:Dihydrolipoamide dehydrogenase of 2-oxoglutarate dehydrogenase n=1 Tax=Velamenicoccus archaeovorus TaxID=1930593 RepID=A0A410P3X0_VELA1|nr:NAD(P)/FAD-dependent oxidoreductase [Candidatus Velamenicoccus archaeovorus]QAT16820.1 dihydrolipoamide dehydrogenase of 2-oxoglutarate dehydrogenase [Candidatus Velamenicoccus archaeovorus]